MRRETEKRALQVALSLVMMLPYTAAIAGIVEGPTFLGPLAVVPVDLASHFHYLAGIFMAKLLLYVSCIPDIERKGGRLQLLCFLTVAGGTSRLYSLVVDGMPSTGHQAGLVIELVIAPAILLWQMRVARRYA